MGLHCRVLCVGITGSCLPALHFTWFACLLYSLLWMFVCVRVACLSWLFVACSCDVYFVDCVLIVLLVDAFGT